MTRLVLTGEGLRGLSEPKVSGEALLCPDPISFLGGVDPETGRGIQQGHPLQGRSVAGKVLVFPTGCGSTVGSYVLVNLKRNGVAPAAIVNQETDVVVLIGAVLADIPLVHRFDADPLEKIPDGATVTVDARRGTVAVETDERAGATPSSS